MIPPAKAISEMPEGQVCEMPTIVAIRQLIQPRLESGASVAPRSALG
jgi:hypothetical protein